jgi:hypothetical protein
VTCRLPLVRKLPNTMGLGEWQVGGEGVICSLMGLNRPGNEHGFWGSGGPYVVGFLSVGIRLTRNMVRLKCCVSCRKQGIGFGFTRNKNGVGRFAVFALAARGGAERREGLKKPPLLSNLGLVANSIPMHCVRLGGFAGYRADCPSGTANVRGHFNLDIYYMSIVHEPASWTIFQLRR